MFKKVIITIALTLCAPVIYAESLSTTTCPGAGCVDYNVSSQGSLGIQITGTWVGTLTFQSSIDGVNFVSFGVTSVADTTSAKVTTTTGNGTYQATVAGLRTVRIVFTAYTSGTAVTNARMTTVAGKFSGGGGGGGSGTVTSVDVSVPSALLAVSGNPITTTGTLAFSLPTRAANIVFAGPATGSAATPTFRALVTADMPSGTGTVTSIATTSPITGGTITTTGTIACATCGVTGSPLSQFASTTSLQLLGTISDETGTGSAVFATSPTLVTPVLGAATATSINGNFFTTGSSTYTGTAGQTYTFPTTSATIARTDAANTFTGASTATSWILTTPAITTSATLSNNGIGAVTTDGFIIQNTTAAAAGAQQWSPRLRFIGQGWKTTATAASQQVEWTTELQPGQDSTTPNTRLVFTPYINSVAGTTIVFCGVPTSILAPSLDVSGSSTFCRVAGETGAGLGPVNSAGNAFGFYANNGILVANLNTNGFGLTNTKGVFWTSGSVGSSSTGDTGLCRGTAGQIIVNDGTATCTNARDILVRHPLGGGTAPTVANTSANSCGTTTATISGTDAAGKITVGATSGTSCTITFGTAWSNAPACTAGDETTSMLVKGISTTTTLILSATAFGAGDVIAYHCQGF